MTVGSSGAILMCQKKISYIYGTLNKRVHLILLEKRTAKNQSKNILTILNM